MSLLFLFCRIFVAIEVVDVTVAVTTLPHIRSSIFSVSLFIEGLQFIRDKALRPKKKLKKKNLFFFVKKGNFFDDLKKFDKNDPFVKK